MMKGWSHYRNTVRFAFILIPILAGLFMFSVVTATPSPAINTNDGLVDPNWGAALYTSTCSDANVADNNEIKNAWIQNNGSEYYFRFQTCAAPAIGGGQIAMAQIDCDHNGSLNTASDRWILYKPSDDYQSIRDGTNASLTSQCPGAAGTPCEYGERVNTPNDDNIEWRLDTTLIPNVDGSAFPPNCRDVVNVAFAIMNASNGNIINQSPLYGWNGPTEIQMTQIQANSRPDFTPLAIGLIGLVIVGGIGGLLYLRKSHGVKPD